MIVIRRRILTIAVWSLSILIIGAWFLCFTRDVLTVGYWVNGYIMIVVDIVLWALIWLVGVSCRVNYEIQP